MEKRTNMYKLSVDQWNPFVGCEHYCVYCQSSFQRQLKRWAKKNCPGCYEFTPHMHPERLNQSLPKTKYMQFIFTCSSGDIAFCPNEYLEKITARIQGEPDNQRTRVLSTGSVFLKTSFLVQPWKPTETSNYAKELRSPLNHLIDTKIS
jgi:hypothetical protein